MTADEHRLRLRLNDLALAEAWQEWDLERLVLADCLEDEGRYPEAAMSRAAWRLVRVSRIGGPARGLGRPFCWTFACTVSWSAPRKLPALRNKLVQTEVLGFAPGTLLVKECGYFNTLALIELLTTWVPARSRHKTTYTRPDTTAHPLGLAGLWAEEKQQPSLFFGGPP